MLRQLTDAQGRTRTTLPGVAAPRGRLVYIASPNVATFGDLLRSHRLAAGLTQQELAERARLSVDAIGTLERGVRRAPRAETVKLLSAALELSADDCRALLAASHVKRPLTSDASSFTDSPVPEQGDALRPGKRLTSAERVTPSPDALKGVAPRIPTIERKLVTVLFADVAGSTALGDELDPEDLGPLLSRYYTHARRVVAEHGGAVEKFIGDAVMAVFGLPRAHSDDAERVLAAALALRESVEHDATLANLLALRLGINTGQVVTTIAHDDLTRDDILVTGDAVNVAARLEQLATPGEILASERTARATMASFLFGAPRDLDVKGTNHPLHVYPLASKRTARLLSRPPLVGRADDLAQLALLRDRALRERRPQLVSILAPAGTGKTRLIEEFRAGLDMADGWRVAIARCLPYGQSLAYWPLRGLLEELLEAPLSLESVGHALRSGRQASTDVRRLAGVIFAALGVESEGQVEREVLYSAWRSLIEALARQAPRIVVFEDLHWASESLLDLVESLMRPGAEAPFLIISTSRAELLDRRPTWGGGRRSITAMALESLRKADARTLARALLQGASEAVQDRIAERSGGNPFFAIERARGLNSEGADAGELPDTVQEALQERLDALPPRERAVARAAAVVGREFHAPMLQAMLDTPSVAEVVVALDGLLAREIVAPIEGDAYTFDHILIRDVAYSARTRAERVRLHVAAARWLEVVAGAQLDEHIELIAYHYREALRLVRESATPIETPVDITRVVTILVRAGELAGWSGAFTEARESLEAAIAVAPKFERARLHEKLGDCMLLGDTAIHAYRMAYDHWRESGGQSALVGARILRKLLMLYLRWPATWRSSLPGRELLALMDDAQRLATASGDMDELWRIRVAEACGVHEVFWIHNDWARDDPRLAPDKVRERTNTLLEAAAYFEQRRDWPAYSEALDGLAGISNFSGAYVEAVRAVKRRLRAPNIPATERGDAVNMLAHVLLWSGHYGLCVKTMQSAVARLRPIEPVILLGKGPLWAAGAAELSGRWDDLDWLIPLLQAGLEQVQRDRGMVYVAAGYFVKLHVALAREDERAARAALSMLDQLLSTDWAQGVRALIAAYHTDSAQPLAMRSPSDVWVCLRMREFQYVGALTLMFLSERDTPASSALLAHARSQAEDEGTEFLRRVLTVAEAVAEDDTAQLALAVEEMETRGFIPHAARMRIVLAQRTGDLTHLERARPVLERLGDRQFLRRLDGVAAGFRA